MLESRAQILQFTRGSGFTVHVPLEFYRILRHMKLSTECQLECLSIFSADTPNVC